jgi:hypothetical protein
MVVAALNIRKRSLLRGTVLVMGSLTLAFLLAGFPNDHPSLKLLIPVLLAVAGMWDTMRCLQRRWSLYHGSVVLLVFADILALFMILFLLLYPYTQWLL